MPKHNNMRGDFWAQTPNDLEEDDALRQPPKDANIPLDFLENISTPEANTPPVSPRLTKV